MVVTTRSRLLCALVGAILALSACGGDESDASVGTVAPASIAASTTTTVATTTTSIATVATTTTNAPNFEGTPEFDTNSSVSTVGIDAVTFGMTLARAESAVAGTFVPIGEVSDCYQVHPSGGPNGVLLTITEGTVERVDITNPDITTRSGAGVGMSEDGLASLFGDSLTTEASDTGGNRIIFTPSDPNDAAFRVIFETDGTAVTSFRSGRLPQVDATTAC